MEPLGHPPFSSWFFYLVSQVLILYLISQLSILTSHLSVFSFLSPLRSPALLLSSLNNLVKTSSMLRAKRQEARDLLALPTNDLLIIFVSLSIKQSPYL